MLSSDLSGATRHLHELPPEQFRLLADYHRTLERVFSDRTAAPSFPSATRLAPSISPILLAGRVDLTAGLLGQKFRQK
jgi:hypothetical protein